MEPNFLICIKLGSSIIQNKKDLKSINNRGPKTLRSHISDDPWAQLKWFRKLWDLERYIHRSWSPLVHDWTDFDLSWNAMSWLVSFDIIWYLYVFVSWHFFFEYIYVLWSFSRYFCGTAISWIHLDPGIHRGCGPGRAYVRQLQLSTDQLLVKMDLFRFMMCPPRQNFERYK